MKVIVQIPCYNEEATLPFVMADMPRSIPGVDTLETLVIDDGSSDRTVEVALQLGVNHVVRHNGNKGLAAAFQTGLDACLRLGADIIVNTDGDNQYPQAMIPDLIAPILRGEADMVVGDRQVTQIAHFSPVKKVLQVMGSWVVRQASGTPVPDAPSGFRALSREAALRLNVITKYTYTLETIVQAGKKNIKIASVPVTTNKVTRPSRLIRGIFDYLKKSSATIVRIYALYEPLKVFFYIGLFLMLIAAYGTVSLLYHYFANEGMNFRQTFERHTPTTIATLVALVFGFQIWLIGLLADLMAAGRRLTEEALYRVKRMELDLSDLLKEGRGTVDEGRRTKDEGRKTKDEGQAAMEGGQAAQVGTVGVLEETHSQYSTQHSANGQGNGFADGEEPAVGNWVLNFEDAAPPDSREERDFSPIFERFTEPARNTFRLAQEEARRSNTSIGTEHILLGLVREEGGLASRVLEGMGVRPKEVRLAVERIIGQVRRITKGGRGRLTPASVRVLELAEEEARRLNHTYIGTEHLLIGLVREGESVAAGVLHDLGVSLPKVRLGVLEALKNSG